jgi:hypothetical protein
VKSIVACVHHLRIYTKYFYLFATLTPVGDTLTLDFAKALIENEKLSQNDSGVPDFLQISFFLHRLHRTPVRAVRPGNRRQHPAPGSNVGGAIPVR